MLKKYLLISIISLSIPAFATEGNDENIMKTKSILKKRNFDEVEKSNLENKKKKIISFNTVSYYQNIFSCFESENIQLDKNENRENILTTLPFDVQKNGYVIEMIDESTNFDLLYSKYGNELKKINQDYDSIIKNDFYNNEKIKEKFVIIWKNQIDTSVKWVDSILNSLRVKLNSKIIDKASKEEYKEFIQNKIMSYSQIISNINKAYNTLNDDKNPDRDKIELVLPILFKSLDEATTHIFELTDRGFILGYISFEDKKIMEDRIINDFTEKKEDSPEFENLENEENDEESVKEIAEEFDSSEGTDDSSDSEDDNSE